MLELCFIVSFSDITKHLTVYVASKLSSCDGETFTVPVPINVGAMIQ